MSSRDAILAAVRAGQPPDVPLPDRMGHSPESGEASLDDRFAKALRTAAAEVVVAGRDDVWPQLLQRFGDARLAASPLIEAPDSVERIGPDTPIATLADLDVLVCRGALGVAENGAVWLPESRCGHRAAPFLARRVVLLVDRTAIVPTMHEAYARIDSAAEGFGAFIAGPSKTADIEQALVIGAHGPLGLTVVIVD